MNSEKNLKLLERMLRYEMETADEYSKYVQKLKDAQIAEKIAKIRDEEFGHAKMVSEAIKREKLKVK